jgi:hypothetical protein
MLHDFDSSNQSRRSIRTVGRSARRSEKGRSENFSLTWRFMFTDEHKHIVRNHLSSIQHHCPRAGEPGSYSKAQRLFDGIALAFLLPDHSNSSSPPGPNSAWALPK